MAAHSVVVHPTPNPNARKFVLPRKLFAQPINCGSAAQAQAHSLAAQLFALHGVYNVLLAQDFVTINKQADVAWEPLERAAAAQITAWLEAGGRE